MPTWTGSFNNSGSPVLRVKLYGISDQVSQEFDAIIDTGFSGFISMPAVQAFPLGLVLTGTTTTILADGSESVKLTALGTAAVAGESRMGTILLNLGTSDVLVGTEFIKSFGKTLFLYQKLVALFDNADVTDFIRRMTEAAEAATKAAAASTPGGGSTETLSAIGTSPPEKSEDP